MKIDYCNSTERDQLVSLFQKRNDGDPDLKPLYTYLCPVIIFICFFSILFNAVLMTISRQNTVVNKSPILLLSLNLAVTDLIASLLNGFSILHNSYLPEVFGVLLLDRCSVMVVEAIRCAALVASALHLLALAFVHYRGIVNPLHYRSTIFFSQHLSRTINLISIVCWILPVTVMLAWFSSTPCQGFRSPDCEVLFLWSFSFRYMILTVFALPLILMSIIYLRIFIIISRHQKSRRVNHDRSALSRGVISAAAPMVTAAAVNLPELINKADTIRCAACAARALHDDGESSISDLYIDHTQATKQVNNKQPETETETETERRQIADDFKSSARQTAQPEQQNTISEVGENFDISEDGQNTSLEAQDHCSGQRQSSETQFYTRICDNKDTSEAKTNKSTLNVNSNKANRDKNPKKEPNIANIHRPIITNSKSRRKILSLATPTTFFYLIKPKILGARSHFSANPSNGNLEKQSNNDKDLGGSMPSTGQHLEAEAVVDAEAEAEAEEADTDTENIIIGSHEEDPNKALLGHATQSEQIKELLEDKAGYISLNRIDKADKSADSFDNMASLSKFAMSNMTTSEPIRSSERKKISRTVQLSIDDRSNVNIGSARLSMTDKRQPLHHRHQEQLERLKPLECTCDIKSRLETSNLSSRSKLIRSNTIANDTKISAKSSSNNNNNNNVNTATQRSKRSLEYHIKRHLSSIKSMSLRSSHQANRSLDTDATRLGANEQLISRNQLKNSTINPNAEQLRPYCDDININSNDVISTNTTALTTATTYEPQRRHVHASAVPQTNTKALITTLLILGTYFTSYVPAIIMQALTCVDHCPYPMYEIPFVQRVKWGAVTTLLLIVKSIIDPFIYTYRMSEIQVAINRYFSKKRSRSTFGASLQQTSQRYNISAGLLVNNSTNTNICTNQRTNNPINTTI